MTIDLICYSMDNWSLYVDYLSTVFHLIDGDSKESDYISYDGEKPDKTTADCVRFLCQLQEENCRQVHRLRGPYLAQLEFFAKLKARGENAEPYLGNCNLLFYVLYTCLQTRFTFHK